ncbi:RNA methyltransferase [Chondromyces apiculatus]|uniref:23S rRNA (Guanosine-2'-O-)-methyltransferase rlmB n=1 Tax=Chondromyces apiculatus DSM 436 TaxID=1192034 RepID=A0A017TGZ3_9BACT|nr:RNA methyltransferase [Chondromyces apiculatus]EYF08202.1 23S rRNA (guanosine-2'-O-) -methyltransferase rlmB [Chondromyces apiculatus DSM 436]
MPPKLIRVYSEDNHFQRAEVLKRNRTKRHKYGEFFVEGVRSINEALRCGWKINAFLYPRDVQLSGWAREILATSKADAHLELPAALLDKLSEKNESSEIAAIISTPKDDLARIPVRDDLLVLLLDRPTNPGNFGTTIRAAAAFGAHGIVVTGHTADLYDPITVRASVGTLFSQTIVRVSSNNELLPWLEGLKPRIPGLQLVVSGHEGEHQIHECNFRRPTVLVLGNETRGASTLFKDLADETARIPLEGVTTSLNVSCAASIFLYEIARQRRFSRE